jgi:hypothetical protein
MFLFRGLETFGCIGMVESLTSVTGGDGQWRSRVITVWFGTPTANEEVFVGSVQVTVGLARIGNLHAAMHDGHFVLVQPKKGGRDVVWAEQNGNQRQFRLDLNIGARDSDGSTEAVTTLQSF